MDLKAEFKRKSTMLRLAQVLEVLPMSRSTFYAGIGTGRFPRPVKVGRLSMWPLTEIENCIREFDTRASHAADTPEQDSRIEVATRLSEEFHQAVRSVVLSHRAKGRTNASANRTSRHPPLIPMVVSRRT